MIVLLGEPIASLPNTDLVIQARLWASCTSNIACAANLFRHC